MRRRIPMLAFLASFAALAVTMAACGGGGNNDGGSGTTGPLPSVDSVLPPAIQAFDAMKTFHFRLEHENGGSPIPPGLMLETADGDVIVPDRMSAKLEAKAGQQTVRVEVIGIGDEGWITNPFSREWQPLPSGTTIKDIFDPAQGVKAIVGSLQDAQVTAEEKVDGTPCYRVEGTIASDVLTTAVPIAKPGLTVGIKVWIGKDDSRIYQVYLVGPIAPDEPSNIVRRITLSKFDEEITINSPV
jgi:lipoprotein LprG